MRCNNCRTNFQEEKLRALLVFKGDDTHSAIYTICPNCTQKEDSIYKEGWFAEKYLFLRQKRG